MHLIRISLILFAFAAIDLASGGLSTVEKIKKHKEWLLKRAREKLDSAKNEVYPEEVTTSSRVTLKQLVLSTTTEPLDTTIFYVDNATTTTEASVTDEATTFAPPTTTTFVPPTTTTATTVTTTTKRSKAKQYPRWGSWSDWSLCSRTCGGGVMAQQRKCISRRQGSGKLVISKDCIGVYKRFHLCNEQPCPANELDFRHHQCSSYNNVQFQGRTYEWEPYVKDDAECELNCKPIGMKYFATLNQSVIDGTACSRPAEFYRQNYRGRAICVGGICKAIHASGVIAGLSANSGTVNCGGLVCRPISGIFTKNPLPEDAYIHVATIPAGASNISITELKNSVNLLVLRTSDQKYLFNGDNSESPSGSYESAGVPFDYRRIDGIKVGEGVTEWITSTGPIREALELMIYAKTTNPGVKYEYLLPISSASDENEISVEQDGVNLKAGADESVANRVGERRRRKYNWKVVGFSPCSKSCGGGNQTPIIRCVRDSPSRYFAPRRCAHSEKPTLNENLLRCNTQPCPAYWRVEEWGECQCSQGEGARSRDLRCVQELATGIVIQVNHAACLEEEPETKKTCDCPKVSRRRNHNRYKGFSSHGRISTAPANMTMPSHHHQRVSDKAGVWLTSEWNKQCSATCGSGVEHRSIFCDRSHPNKERCDLRLTPDTTRACESEKSCDDGEWFAAPWSQCAGSCFNLTKSRSVICIKNLLIVDDEECKLDQKPETLKNCTLDEVSYCRARWHYSEWSECTKLCESGTQRRTVKCLEIDPKENILRESTECRYSEREVIYRSCNTEKCYEPRVDLIQNDIAPTCTDVFSTCHRVVQAKLCSNDYYFHNCCHSCSTLRN